MSGVLLWIIFFHRCFHLLSAYSESSYDFYISEEIPLNTLVGTVDLDVNNTYRTSASNPGVKDLFSLSHSTGEIRSLHRIDRETINAFNDTVDLIIVSQSASLISIHIHIDDINDNPPLFAQRFYNVSVVEGANIGSKFSLQGAKDPDKNENGMIARYILKADDSTVPNPFKLSRITDVDGIDTLFLELVGAIDREKKASYSFELKAVDGGTPPLGSASSLVVTILDVNDNAPEFEDMFKNITIKSMGKMDENIANVTAHDADIGLNSKLVYSLLDNIQNQFDIDPESGMVTRKKKKIECRKESCPLCSPNLCVLSVEASDHGTPKLTGRSFLNLHLTEENLYAPQINFKIYSKDTNYILLDSNSVIGTTLAVLTVTDEDYGRDGQTRVSFISGNGEGFFILEVGQNFAILRLNRTIDQKTPKQFVLEFQASDFGLPPRKSTKNLNIYVKNDKDKPPRFEKERYQVKVKESIKVGSRILKMKTSVGDGLVEYKLMNDSTKLPFSVNPKTGVVKVSAGLDFERQAQYEFDVKAVNLELKWLKSTAHVTVQVLDINNHAPRLLEKRPFVFIDEDHDIHEPIYHVKCLDLDYAENAATTYSVFESTGLVRIDQNRGDVHLKAPLDYEAFKNFTFRVTCADNGTPSKADSTLVSVFVMDVNDNAPFFKQEQYEVNIRKNDPIGTFVASPVATDFDEIDDKSLTYFIVNSPVGIVDIDKNSGKLHTISLIDPQKYGSTFKVVVGARDAADHSTTNNAAIIVHVIDDFTEIPRFVTTTFAAEIEENTATNHLVGNFVANVSHKGFVEYNLLRGGNELFLDRATGELRTRITFDHEKQQTVDFTVAARTSKAVAVFEGRIDVVDVNDNRPVFVGKREFFVDLNELPIGAVFGKVLFTDADSRDNGQMQYSTNSDLVGIGRDTGMLWIKPKNEVIKENQWQIAVEATDQGIPKLTTTVNIVIKFKAKPENVLMPQVIQRMAEKEIKLNQFNSSRFEYTCTADVDGLDDCLSEGDVFFDDFTSFQPLQFIPITVVDTYLDHVYSSELHVIRDLNTDNEFKCPVGELKVEENLPVNSIVTQKVDPQHVGRYQFKLINGHDKFSVNPMNGVISTNAVFDAEKQNRFVLDLVVSNVRTKSQVKKCRLKVNIQDVNDNSPVFERLYYHHKIESDFTGVVIKVKATDLDVDLVNKRVVYSLLSGENRFGINRDTGELFTRHVLEAASLYNVTVIAQNKDSTKNTSAFVLIQTLADSKAKPVIRVPTDITVSETTDLGSIIATVNAQAQESAVHFDIIDGNLLSTFEMDPYQGYLLLARPLDYERIQMFNLTVIARTKHANTTAKIKLNVQNERDNAPVLRSKHFIVQENQPVNTAIGSLVIEDLENRSPSTLMVEIVYQLPENGKFFVDADNVLIAGESLDREAVDSYRLLIKVTDKKDFNSTSHTLLTVDVSDDNDNAPKCVEGQAFMVPEHAIFPLQFEVKCVDVDRGYNSSVGYKLVNGTDNFKMEWSGIIWIKKQLIDPVTVVSVAASDRSSMDSTNEVDDLRKTSLFHVVFIKENPGKIFASTDSDYVFNLSSLVGTNLGKLPVIKTGGPSTINFYGLNQQVSDPRITVEDKTGNLKVINRDMDIYTDNGSKFLKTIVGIDSLTHKTEIHKVTIINNHDDGHFVVPKSFYEFKLVENTKIDTLIGKIQVFGSKGLQFQFHINETQIPFRIDSKTGEISVHREVDFENAHFFKNEITISSSTLAATVPVYFIIEDVNDNPPVFSQKEFNFFVREDALIGEFVGRFQATDADSGKFGKIRYQLLGNPASLFILDTVSGIVTLAGKLDHEKDAFYKFEVRCYDVDGLDSRTVVYVFVEDVNDNPPHFLEEESTAVNVLESAKIGTPVHQFKFDDLDSVNNFNFEIDAKTDGYQHFSIDNNGFLVVNNILDRELISEYKLRVILKDSFPPFDVHVVDTFIVVKIDDVNDNAPIIPNNLTFVVSEQAPIGTVVGIVTAVDKDADANGLNSLVKYRIDPSSNPKAVFVVDSLLGYLMVNKPLDREVQQSYKIRMIAQDSGSPMLSSSTWITVIVSDEDDNSPVLTSNDLTRVEIDDNVQVGSLIATINYSDPDVGANAAVIFDLLDGFDLFRIDTFNGHVFTVGHLDVDVMSEYFLNVSLTPFSGRHSVIFTTVQVIVTNKTDKKLQFVEGNMIRLEIAENMQIDYPLVVRTIKVDGSKTGIKYSLTSGNGTFFSMDSMTGDLMLNQALDFEVNPSFSFTVRAVDSDNQHIFATTDVVINVVDVNDNAPAFLSPSYRVSINENVELDQPFLTVNATDADSGENGEIRYSIANTENVPFVVNFMTGELRLLGRLDYEESASHVVYVQATDGGRFEQHTSTVRVQVSVLDENDNAPVISVLNQDVLIRPDTKNGNVVFVVDVHDADENDRIKLSVTGPDHDQFAIDKRGVIRAKNRLRKEQTEYSIGITAVDEALHNSTIQLNFIVSDYDEQFPVFRPTDTRFKIFENETNFKVVKLHASSPINGHCVRYSIASGNSGHNFYLDSFSGELTVVDLDFEKKREHHLYIAAVDCSTSSYISFQPLVVSVKDVNDNAPLFQQPFYKVVLRENDAPSGDAVLHLTAVDADSNGKVQYSIIAGNTNNAFEIDSNNGNLYQIAQLDREEHDVYKLVVEAKDAGTPILSNNCTVLVQVKDVNDNSPKFSRLLKSSIPEDAPIGSFITQIVATDADTPEFSKNYYSIDGVDAEYFEVDEISGNLTLKKELDREQKSVYKIKVFSQDGFWKVSASMTILVDDVNDNAPQFSQKIYNFTVSRGRAVAGQEIGMIKAVDQDIGENGKVLYFVSSGAEMLHVDPDTGLVVLLIDLAAGNEFSFVLGAMDMGVPSKSASVLVNILVVDVISTNVCEFDKTDYVFVVTKMTDKMLLFDVFEDGSRDCLYGLENSTLNAAVDPTTGLIHFDPVDFKMGQIVKLRVTKGSLIDSSNQSTAIVSLIATNAEAVVEFDWILDNFNFTVIEERPVGTSIGHVLTNSEYVKYSIPEAEDIPFGIDRNTGRLFNKQRIDYDVLPTAESFTFHVTATFVGYPSKEISTLVKIFVEDTNDNHPEFAELEKVVFVSGTIPVGSVVFTAEAFDADGPRFNTVLYSLVKNDNFDIDTKSGEIFAMTNLDFSMSNHYDLIIRASNFNLSQYSECKVVLQLRTPLQNTAMFVTKHVQVEISKRSVISTVVAQLDAHTIFGSVNYFVGNSYDSFGIDKNEGLLQLSKKLEKTGPFDLTAIVKSGALKRQAPSTCTVRIATNNLAPAPVFPESKYIVNISSDANVDFEVIKFNFALPTDATMAVEGDQHQDFCFDRRGVLKVCLPILQDKYRLKLVIASDGEPRSHATLEVYVQPKNDDYLTISASNTIATVVENCQEEVRLLQLKTKGNSVNEGIKFVISDNHLADLFSLNSTTGILTAKKPFDRERRSLYLIPVMVSDENYSKQATVHVFVDDEDDNEAVATPLTLVLSSFTPLMSGIVPFVHPVDADEVYDPDCHAAKINEHLIMNQNCSILLSDFGESLSTSTKFGTNHEYHVNINYLVTDEDIFNQRVVVKIRSSRRSVADFLQKLQGSIPDMTVQIVGAFQSGEYEYSLFLSVLGASNVVLPASETLRVLDNFYQKKKKLLDVIDYHGYLTVCDEMVCKTNDCQQITVKTDFFETFRSVDRLWHVPRMNILSKCGDLDYEMSPTLADKKCGKLECVHGKCMDNKQCLCDANYFGDNCASRIYSFGHSSRLEFDSDKKLSTVSFWILTKESHGILLISESEASNSTLVVDYINGKPRITVVTSSAQHTSMLQESINDGHWHRITVNIQSKGTIALVLDKCKDECVPCQSMECHTAVPAIILDKTLKIGSLSGDSSDIQSASTFLRACLKLIQINGHADHIFTEVKMLNTCPLFLPNSLCESSEAVSSCRQGVCVPDWDDYICICDDGVEASSCDTEDHSVSFNEGILRLFLSPFTRNQLGSKFKEPKIAKREDKFFDLDNSDMYPCDVVDDSDEHRRGSRLDGHAVQWLELDIRTAKLDTTIFVMKYGSQRAELKVVNGSIHYGVYFSTKLIVEIVAEKFVSDAAWHRISIEVSSSGAAIRLKIDEHGREIDSYIAFPQFMFKELEYVQFGASEDGLFFTGCMRRLVINNQLQLLNQRVRTLPKQYFTAQVITHEMTIQPGCETKLICGNSVEDELRAGCSQVLMSSKTRYTIFIGICSIVIALAVLLTLGLIRLHKSNERKRLRMNTQRISNLQLVSTTSDHNQTYKNWSYDEVNLPRRSGGYKGCDNEAYLSHNSLDSTHIYDEAATGSDSLEDIHPPRNVQKPMVMPRKKMNVNQPSNSITNPQKSRFFRPGENFGLFPSHIGGHALPISLDEFHHESDEIETGQMSERV